MKRAAVALIAVIVASLWIPLTELRVFASHVAAISLTQVMESHPAPLPLVNETPAIYRSPNGTILVVEAPASPGYQDLVYSTFEVGVDGWRYFEQDPDNVIEWVWVNESGYMDWGYTGFIVTGIPRALLPTTYGYSYIWENFTAPLGAINITLFMAYSYWANHTLLLPAPQLQIYVYNWSSGNATEVYSTYLITPTSATPFPNTSSDWRTLTLNLTSYVVPGQRLAIVIGVVWPQTLVSYNATLFIDDVFLVAYLRTKTFSGAVANATYTGTSTARVYAVIAGLQCVNSSLNITLVNGVQTSTPIQITNCAITSPQTTAITVAQQPLYNEMQVEARYVGTGTVNATIYIVTDYGGHRIIEKLTIYIP